MIKISKLADYAVVTLAQLATYNKAATAAELSVATRLPAPTVAKVLKALAKAGLVAGARGATGGYTLLKSADEISVLHIVTAVDGPVRVTECADSGITTCGTSAQCGLHHRWGPVNHALIDALKNIPLTQLLRTPVKAKVA